MNIIYCGLALIIAFILISLALLLVAVGYEFAALIPGVF